MKPSVVLTGIISLSTFCSASPLLIGRRDSNSTTNSTISQPFYLVTTTQNTTTSSSSLNSSSSTLQNVSLTTLFAPYYQPANLLRLIQPGYESVPRFTLEHGRLRCEMPGPHGFGDDVYNSTVVRGGQELKFYAEGEGETTAEEEEEDGGLELRGGYLLVNKKGGEAEGWTICVEELGQSVIEYKGTDVGCTPTYIQAVSAPPY